MVKPINTKERALLDLMNAHTELQIASIQTNGVNAETAARLAEKIAKATTVLQRTIGRAARLLEQGVTDDEE